ncbi:MAG: phage tail protein [Tannerellaceae bacterium]|nr:phage tail protein [Tannerellaceae bacterium]
MSGEVLPVAFYFRVRFAGVELAFKEVSGLTTEMELETVQEGGVNHYEYRLPKQTKHPNLVMKRALEQINKQEISWIQAILENDFSQPVKPIQITVDLLNAKEEPLYTWACNHAFPVKWEVDTLDSEKNSVLIETLEFSYTTLIRS